MVVPPADVVIPKGTRIAVELDTPLSTRISKAGQQVTFRSAESVALGDQIELPPQTAFTGSVVKVRRPGAFGRPGELRVKVERIELAGGTTASVAARLDSADGRGRGMVSSDRNRVADLYSLATWTLNGTLLGSAISGGKGAGIGAGAGAAVALIILASRRGPDVYLEPGMPFTVILDEAVTLSGADVVAAQKEYTRTFGSRSGDKEGAEAGSSEISRNPDGAVLDSDRPQLKRRPKHP